MQSMESAGSNIDLPDTVVSVLPSDPFEQLDIARKITSFAIATRVFNLEAESSHLRSKLNEKEKQLVGLQSQIGSLDASLKETKEKLAKAEKEKERLRKENAELSNSVQKLNGDVSKDSLVCSFNESPPYFPSSQLQGSENQVLSVGTHPLVSEEALAVNQPDVSQVSIDYSSIFTTNKVFTSRKELVEWTRDTGKKNGMAIVIARSDLKGIGRVPRIWFTCEKFGKYRAMTKKLNNSTPSRRVTKVGKNKCQCPFELKATKLPNDDDWKIEVKCGWHNHPITNLEGHPLVRRLSEEEYKMVVDMAKNSAKPKTILNALKSRDEQNCTTLQTIYNVMKKLKLKDKAGRTHMQTLKDVETVEHLERIESLHMQTMKDVENVEHLERIESLHIQTMQYVRTGEHFEED